MKGAVCKALGVYPSQAGVQGTEQQKPCLHPKQNCSKGPTWQQRILAAQKDRNGEQQAGLPRSPEKWGRGLKALTQRPRGQLLSCMQPGRGDTSFTEAVDTAQPRTSVNRVQAGAHRVCREEVWASVRGRSWPHDTSLAPRPWLPEHRVNIVHTAELLEEG